MGMAFARPCTRTDTRTRCHKRGTIVNCRLGQKPVLSTLILNRGRRQTDVVTLRLEAVLH